MEPYYERDGIAIYNCDCREVGGFLGECAVDSIVTDPPYGLAFMGKEWDHGVPGEQFWSTLSEVCKPGAMMLAFGGTRKFHRLACAIEDAGWEIRDCINWLYGCLSDDTEVLTKDGWELYHTARTKEILAYDPETDIYQWEKPSRWSEYRVESDTAYRIESDSTDQIVSRNHRCLVEREGSLSFVQAEELACVERVPYLQGDVPALLKSCGELLFAGVLRQGEGLAEAALVEWQGQEASWEGAVGREESSLERRSYLLQEEGEIREPNHQVRALSGGVCFDGSQGRLRDGASPDCGEGVGQVALANRVCPSCQPRRHGQSTGQLDAICVERGPQTVRTQTSYRTTLATVTPIEYSGVIFCPTVSTGAFVARRNSKVFVTGNSGFPKSLDISKAIDAKLKTGGSGPKNLRKRDMGDAYRPHELAGSQGYGDGRMSRGADTDRDYKDAPPVTTPEALEWQGWGTALKPAWEPIIVAMKSLDGTFAANALRHRVAGLNIDGCRVEAGSEVIEQSGEKVDIARGKCAEGYDRPNATMFRTGKPKERGGPANEQGRFPANVIHDGSDEVLAGFPQTTSGKPVGIKAGGKLNCFGHFEGGIPVTGFGDSGSAARFFYCAKASSSERGSRPPKEQPLFGDSDPGFTNTHPTVKPLALMTYLLQLVSTPTGGIVLDPFMGSGSTLVAAKALGRKAIGIEINKEYCDIAIQRLNGT